jgi:hypothetical protein
LIDFGKNSGETMKKVEKARRELLNLYKEWVKEFVNIEQGKFLDKKYSNPYYISIPDDWFEGNVRIMVVGEEGYGEWGCGKQYGWTTDDQSWAFNDFKSIINYNRIKILKQVDEIKLKAEEIDLCKKTNSKFWERFDKLYKIAPCVWNNFDKIHKCSNSNCQLNAYERKQLHKNGILAKEIEILDPHFVVFFGWRSGSALKMELRDVYEKLYPQGIYDNTHWREKIDVINMGDRTYIFTYHPERKTMAYGKMVDEQISKMIKR